MRNNRGFTVLEIVIAISISTMVMLGLSFFISEINSKIISSQNKGNIYTSINDFIDKVGVKKNLYGSSTILTQNQNYNTLLLTNTLSNGGILIGVVNNNKISPYYMKLDPVGNYSTYDNKVLGVRQLTQNQITEIKTNSGSIYNIEFFEDNLFPNLQVKSFNLIDYNLGSIVEMNITFYESFLQGYGGKNLENVPEIRNYDITLNF
ncbi:prepilin-type N-terminal cleavage/methylation domain-containing protein [Candidatus Gracilibacteria bacterium]|nr:prepilin-type N-terminal cleavage/methylation domain-containing protein [Candidatus Gracilibacteria bacterium]